MIRGLRLGVFFTLKTPKKIIELSLGRIFVSGGFRVLRWFFGFLMAIDWFNKVSMVFSRCFGSKQIFGRKNKGPCFSGQHSGRILGCASDLSFANIGQSCLSYPNNVNLVYLLDPSSMDWFIRPDMFVRPKYVGLVCLLDPRHLELASAKPKVT